jgi:hypothetical protein
MIFGLIPWFIFWWELRCVFLNETKYLFVWCEVLETWNYILRDVMINGVESFIFRFKQIPIQSSPHPWEVIGGSAPLNFRSLSI